MQKFEKYHFISFAWFSDLAITPETLPLFFSVQLYKTKLYVQYLEYGRALNISLMSADQWTRIRWNVICVSGSALLVFFLND